MQPDPDGLVSSEMNFPLSIIAGAAMSGNRGVKETYVHRKTRKQIFTAALLIIAKVETTQMPIS